MRACGVVMCGALALALAGPALALDQGLYVGIETRVQRAELSVEKGLADFGGPTLEDVTPYIVECEGRNSINAARVGYVAEIGSDLFIDASVAFGSADPVSAFKISDPSGEQIFAQGFLDSAFYFDIGATLRGSTGSVSYTAGLRFESSDQDEETYIAPGFAPDTSEYDQSLFAIEATVGTTGDVRTYVGIGVHVYKGELVQKVNGAVVTDFEFEYDLPFVAFVGVESSTERVSMFARMSLLGEKFLSTWAGAAVKF